ncbi:MAG TPA: Ger(x)C family spore germination protein [Thermoanaerobacterales bacterium]|nr:Ger(x)C family spore germination protein [Thermoanaerobacterales bacterium]
MYKHLLSFIIIVLLLLTLGGCWSKREIEDIAVVTIMGFDRVTVNGKDQWLLSRKILKPRNLAGESPLGGGQGGKGEEPGFIVSSIGDTISETARDASTRIPRQEFVAHANIIIIGERLAREGVDQLIDAVLRYKDIRLNSHVLVTKGRAIDVLKSKPELEQVLSQEIMGLIETNQVAASKAFIIDMKGFINQLITPGQDATASYIEIFQRVGEGIGDNLSEGSSTTADTGGEKTLRLRGTSVFKKNRLVGVLGDRETKGYLYAIGKAKHGIITLSVKGHEPKDIAFSMTRARSKIIPNVEDGNISFIIDIKAEGDFVQHEGTKSISHPESIREIEKAAADEIKKMVQETIKKAKVEYEADIFGLGERLHKTYPAVWRQVEQDWAEIYPSVEVAVNVETKIRRIGMISDTPVIR